VKAQNVPVFFDGSGWRWRIIKTITIIALILSLIFLIWIVPLALEKTKVPKLYPGTPVTYRDNVNINISPDYLAEKLSTLNTPIIGAGPLIRVVKVTQTQNNKFALDLYSGKVTKVLSDDDITAIGNHQYAIEKYGQTMGKRIALTFDDGPDLHYTPKVLDILSREKVPASFFVVGNNVVKNPDIAKRIVAEGHILGNHTFNHIDFNYAGTLRSNQEINQTQRVIRATTNHDTAYFRPPYAGNDDQTIRDSIKGILYAQKMGYSITSYQFDSNDWQFASGFKPVMPTLDNSDQVILLHDGGGDRSRTLTYVQQLIKLARSKGYTFVNLDTLYPQKPPLFAKTIPNTADRASFATFRALLVWPHTIVMSLFIVTVGLVLVSLLVQIVLANIYVRRTKFKRLDKNYNPRVTAIIPAYNEEKVLEKTVRSMLRSRYKNLDILIVNDGSKDNTWEIAQQLVRKNKRVKALWQDNKGKARALNKGIKNAKGELIICLDADTVFLPQTVTNLVRHFIDPNVGAVAGTVKIGNVQNMLARWQALEYITSINIERNAQAYLNAVLIVPGACGAWRKKALLSAKWYSAMTLAEDCDLTIRLHRAGYRIIQDFEAISYTEGPLMLSSLVKQRFRWVFGNTQSFWKHRKMLLRKKYGWLGMYILPNAVISTLIPILFWPLLVLITIENLIAGNYEVMLLFFVVIMFFNFIVASAGVILMKEKLSYLIAVPFGRFIYSPIRTYILYSAVITALKGAYVGWNKVTRTGTVKNAQYTQLQDIKVEA
jgi:cellulose synthase/poly-beta-1,6-N-acetylglucosamine synthase-like glycosyltransferase/peptidoglycan/xylan/chitin deacetylase (PgdA/CDA1 family)